jgi:hypothetical protein
MCISRRHLYRTDAAHNRGKGLLLVVDGHKDRETALLAGRHGRFTLYTRASPVRNMSSTAGSQSRAVAVYVRG